MGVLESKDLNWLFKKNGGFEKLGKRKGSKFYKTVKTEKIWETMFGPLPPKNKGGDHMLTEEKLRKIGKEILRNFPGPAPQKYYCPHCGTFLGFVVVLPKGHTLRKCTFFPDVVGGITLTRCPHCGSRLGPISVIPPEPRGKSQSVLGKKQLKKSLGKLLKTVRNMDKKPRKK